jgi:hypothetical protein
VRFNRELAHEEVERLKGLHEANIDAGVARIVLERLKSVRKKLGPLVKKLRKFLAECPDVPADGDARELSLGFVVSSDKGRSSAERWVAKPGAYAEEATGRIRGLIEYADKYLKAVEDARNQPDEMEQALFMEEDVEAPPQEAPAPPEPPPPSEPPSPGAETGAAPLPAPGKLKPEIELPRGVDPDILEDVNRVDQCRKIFEATHQQIEVWEGFCLVMLDREATEMAVDELLRMRAEGNTADFNDGALALFEILLGMRAQYGSFVRKVRKYILDLPIGHFGKETMEMTLGFVIVSPRGRERAKMWIEEPDAYKVEACGRIESIISTVMNYQTALRMVRGE